MAYTCDGRCCLDVKLVQVNVNVVSSSTELPLAEGLPSPHHLVKIDDHASISLCTLQLIVDILLASLNGHLSLVG